MNDSFNHTQLKQIEQVMEKVLVNKLGDDYMDRIERIEINTDAACKVGSDNREELVVTQAKVDKHEDQIVELQNFTGLATA